MVPPSLAYEFRVTALWARLGTPFKRILQERIIRNIL